VAFTVDISYTKVQFSRHSWHLYCCFAQIHLGRDVIREIVCWSLYMVRSISEFY